ITGGDRMMRLIDQNCFDPGRAKFYPKGCSSFFYLFFDVIHGFLPARFLSAVYRFIPAQFIDKLPDTGMSIDKHSLNTHSSRPVSQLFRCQIVGKCSVMCAACQDPCLRAGLEIRLWRPECGGNRKIRHWLFCLFADHVIDDQTESVSKVNKRCCHSRSLDRKSTRLNSSHVSISY